MIDKIVLRIENVIGLSHDVEWSYERTRRNGTWSQTAKGIEGPKVRIEISKSAAGHDVRVETNLARIILGHNVRPLSIGELRAAAEMLESLLASLLPGAVLPNLQKWIVCQVELINDWQVENPSAYVVETYRIAHLRRGHQKFLFASAGHNGYTFSFGAKAKRGRLYDKEAEVRDQIRRMRKALPEAEMEEAQRLSKGRLRYEVVIDSKTLGQWLDWRQPHLARSPPSFGRLLDDLGEDPFGLVAMEWRSLVRRWDPTDYGSAAALLACKYPPAKARRLMDAWVHARLVGVEQYRDLFQTDRSTWSRISSDLKAAGVTTGVVEPLEELELHRPAENA